MRAAPEISFEIQSPLAAHFSDTEWVAKPACLCDIFNLFNELSPSLQGIMTTFLKLADKWLHSKPNWNYGGDEGTLGYLTVQTLAEILKD